MRRSKSTNVIWSEKLPSKYCVNAIVPLNLLEEKEKFFADGRNPKFNIKGGQQKAEQAAKREYGRISFQYFYEAKQILDDTVKQFSTLDNFIEHAFGEPITAEEATEILQDYMAKCHMDIPIVWTKEMTSTAQIFSQGPQPKVNKPENRKFAMLLKSSEENIYLRRKGIICLANHEIGTHYFRAINDGRQPWYSDRSRYDLCKISSREILEAEEGLATIHTYLSANSMKLALPAFSYYAACLSEFLSFQKLFSHLERYMKSPDMRWKTCVRLKRALPNVDETGGYGKDQSYFAGAVDILRNHSTIDFKTLMSGKITFREIKRVHRLVRPTGSCLPLFMHNLSDYLNRIRAMARVNQINNIDLSADDRTEVTRSQLLDQLQLEEDVVATTELPPLSTESCCTCFGGRSRRKQKKFTKRKSLKRVANKKS